MKGMYIWLIQKRGGWVMKKEEKIGKQTIVNGIRRGNFRLYPEGELKFSEGCITVVNLIDF